MAIAIIDTERCKACGICIANCKKNAIEMTTNINSGGYNFVELVKENCIGCGICYTVCPDGVFTITERDDL